MSVLTAGHLEVSPLNLTKKSKGIPDESLSVVTTGSLPRG